MEVEEMVTAFQAVQFLVGLLIKVAVEVVKTMVQAVTVVLV